MLSLMKYRFLCMIKNKSLMFWTLAFPLILTTLFASVLRGAYDPDEFKTISLAVVDSAYYQKDETLKNTWSSVQMNDKSMFDLQIVSENEAKQLLDDKKVDGVISDGESIKIEVNKNNINTTIIKSFFTEYEQKAEVVKDLMMQGKSVDEIMNLFHQTQNYITQNDIEDHDLSSVFFYTVLAMVCLFGGQWSMYAIYDIQANQSSRAARLAMTPIHKIQYLFTDFLLCMVFEMVFILIVYSYMAGVLDIAFGEHVFAILAILLAGCLSGNALGTLIGCATTQTLGFKDGLLTSITMLGSFLSGMMMVQIKYLVQLYIPFVNYINPVAMITDGLYSIYYYGIDERFYTNVFSLIILIIVCYSISFFLIRKKSYQSLEAR